MSASNGTDRLSVLELGDVTPDVRPVRIVKDGRPTMVEAYAEGPTCPGSVKARVAKASRIYRETVLSDGPPGEDGRPTQIFVYDEVAYRGQLRDVLAAVIPSLGFEAADVLSGDEDRAIKLLEDLGWREREGAQEEEAEHPNGPGEASTTAGSSPGSRRSTGSRRKRS